MKLIPYVIAGAALIIRPCHWLISSAVRRWKKLQRQQHDKADRILLEAKEQAKTVELQARDSAMKISQSAEAEINRLRSELNKKRNVSSTAAPNWITASSALEQREQTVNKRQSAADKRFNDVEKLHEQINGGAPARGADEC